jgi:hypothetical protein
VHVKVIVCPACSVGSVSFGVMFWRLVLVLVIGFGLCYLVFGAVLWVVALL